MNSERINNDNQILPIKTCLALLGSFFTVASIVYVFTNTYCHFNCTPGVLYVIETVFLFIVIISTFFVIGIRKYRENTIRKTHEHSRSCLKCIKNTIEDGFHHRGLLYLDELIEFEKHLYKSSKVLIYTSELASETNVELEVVNNIKRGVQYKILFFANGFNEEEYYRIKTLYGENHLVDLSISDEYKNSFDGKLATTLGFDIIIYKVSENIIKGYFAVDYVPKVNSKRKCPDINCIERCNLGKNNHRPFYKEVSFEVAKRLYEEGLSIQKAFSQKTD